MTLAIAPTGSPAHSKRRTPGQAVPARAPRRAPSTPSVTAEQIAAAQDNDALLPWPVVVALTGLSRSKLHKMIADKRFVTPIRLGDRCTRFRAGDVRSWLAALAKQGS